MNTYDSHLTGIGGWLIFLAISFVVTILSLIVNFTFWCQEVFNSESLDIILYAETPYLLLFVVWEGVMNVGFLLGYGYLNYLFFSKNYKTPKIFIILQISNILFIVIDSILCGALLDEPPFDNKTLAGLIRIIIYSAIWIPYFLTSIRVKNTFVNGRPNYDTITYTSSIVS